MGLSRLCGELKSRIPHGIYIRRWAALLVSHVRSTLSRVAVNSHPTGFEHHNKTRCWKLPQISQTSFSSISPWLLLAVSCQFCSQRFGSSSFRNHTNLCKDRLGRLDVLVFGRQSLGQDWKPGDFLLVHCSSHLTLTSSESNNLWVVNIGTYQRVGWEIQSMGGEICIFGTFSSYIMHVLACLTALRRTLLPSRVQVTPTRSRSPNGGHTVMPGLVGLLSMRFLVGR